MAEEHLSYAMRNTEAVQSFVSFNAPGDLKDWSFLAVELILLTGILCALAHALRYRRKHHSPSALLTLLGCFLYGLLVDIASYYTVENFWHGEFSVMFLYNRLPLYIALFYPAFIYHAIMTIRRYDFTPLVEAISVGFYGGLTYLIFDNLGPILGWWIWDRSDPTTLPYLNAVPVTSYHWFFTFTGTFALASRIVCWDWVEKGKRPALIAAGVASLPIVTCVIGGLLFVPYNLFGGNGMLGLASALHAVLFALAGMVFVFSFRKPATGRDRLLMVFPLTFVIGHLYIYIAKLDLFFSVDPSGMSSEGLAAGNLLAVVVAAIGSLAILFVSHPVEGHARPAAQTRRPPHVAR
jgi:hypothetical protein